MTPQMVASMGGGGGGASMLGLDPSARVFQMDPSTIGQPQAVSQGNTGPSLNLPADSASLFAPPSSGTGTGTSQTQQYRSLW